MVAITDEYMREMLSRTRTYSVVVLKATAKRDAPGADAIVWEHGRRNFALRAEGLLAIVCPMLDGGDIAGMGIFNADAERTRQRLDEDPGVQAGIFTYEVFTCRSFPGDALPA